MGNLIAGVQMYTLRDYCKTVSGTSAALKKVGEIGYKAVQISGMAEPTGAGDIKKILDDNGLYACSTHTGYPLLMENIGKVIEDHKILGCEGIMCPGLPVELHNKDGYMKAAGDFQRMLPEIKAAGMVLGYHNHAREFQRYDGKTGLQILIDNCPGLESETDLYWVQAGGGDPVYWLDYFTGRCSQIHFKDMGMLNNSQVMPPIGEGNLNWPAILGVCGGAGVKYCLVEMDTPTIDPFDALKKSLDNMRSWGISV